MRINRAAAVLAVIVATGLASAGTASAESGLVGNARFDSAGARVSEYGGLGLGCRVFGFCDGATPADASAGPTVYTSHAAGERVAVGCTIGRGRLYRVGVDVGGEATAGVTPVGNVTVDPGVRVGVCS